MNYTRLPPQKTIEKVIKSLSKNNFHAILAKNSEEARQVGLKLIPEDAEVMTMTSVTNDTIGLNKEINESGRYRSVRNELIKLEREKDGLEMQKIGAAPEYVVGSVHAITEDGHLLIASNSGSQLPAESYGSLHVIFIAGAQKIVKDTNEGIRRIYEHALPLEEARAQKAYGVGSNVSKLLIYNKEPKPGRVHVILVKEVIGF